MADCFLPYRSRLQLNTRFPFLYRWPLLNLWVATHTAWSGTVMIWVYAGFILVHSVPSLSFMKWAQYENRKTPQDDSSMPLTSVQLLGVDFSLFLQVHTTATEGPGHQLFFFSSRTPPSSRPHINTSPSSPATGYWILLVKACWRRERWMKTWGGGWGCPWKWGVLYPFDAVSCVVTTLTDLWVGHNRIRHQLD